MTTLAATLMQSGFYFLDLCHQKTGKLAMVTLFTCADHFETLGDCARVKQTAGKMPRWCHNCATGLCVQ